MPSKADVRFSNRSFGIKRFRQRARIVRFVAEGMASRAIDGSGACDTAKGGLTDSDATPRGLVGHRGCGMTISASARAA